MKKVLFKIFDNELYPSVNSNDKEYYIFYNDNTYYHSSCQEFIKWKLENEILFFGYIDSSVWHKFIPEDRVLKLFKMKYKMSQTKLGKLILEGK